MANFIVCAMLHIFEDYNAIIASLRNKKTKSRIVFLVRPNYRDKIFFHRYPANFEQEKQFLEKASFKQRIFKDGVTLSNFFHIYSTFYVSQIL